MARLMNIDLPPAELQRQTTIAKRLHPHAQHITVKRAGRIDIPHCDDQMIKTSDSHSINPIAEQPKRQPRRSQAKNGIPANREDDPLSGISRLQFTEAKYVAMLVDLFALVLVYYLASAVDSLIAGRSLDVSAGKLVYNALVVTVAIAFFISVIFILGIIV